MRLFHLDGLDNSACFLCCGDLLITVSDDLYLSVRISVGACLHLHFGLFRAFLHIVHHDVFALQVFSYGDLLLGVVFGLNDKLVSLNEGI